MDISDIAQIMPVMPARERILTTAYRLFTRRGIRAVGTDEVIAQSGVAKATLYRHFASKNDLVLAVLRRREELWTLGEVELLVHQRFARAGRRSSGRPSQHWLPGQHPHHPA
jgi:AcrR family transcriptional regulator